MTELLLRWKTKIDWFDIKDWENDNFEIIENEEGFLVARADGYGSLKKYNIIQKGKRYRLKFKISNYSYGSILFEVGGISSEFIIANGDYDIEIPYITTNTDFNLMAFDYNSKMDISELQIEEIGYSPIDIFEDTNILLNYSISDIKEYDKRKATYSKSIKIPGTEKNNNFFRWVFEVNNDNSFNINTRIDASILVDSVTLIDGFVIMNDIIMNDDKIVYKINFYSKQLNLFSEIGDDTLETLDISELNHTVTYQNIIDSWNFPNTPANENYTYPWINYGREYEDFSGFLGTGFGGEPSIGLTVRDFYPAVSFKYVFDKIFEKYGFEYNSDFLNLQRIKKLILPYSNKSSLLDGWHLSTTANFVGTYEYNINAETCAISHKYYEDYFVASTGGYIRCTENGIPSYWKSQTITSRYNYPNSDVNKYKQYNFGPWTNAYITPPYPISGPANETNNENYQRIDNIIPGSYLTKKAGKYKMVIKYKVYDCSNWAPTLPYVGLFLNAGKIRQDDVSFIYSNYIHENMFKVNSGAEEVIQVEHHQGTTGWIEREYIFDCDINELIYFKFHQFSISDTFKVAVDTIKIYEYGWGDGVEVNMNNCLKKEVKIKDFISDVIALFNLYIDVDKENSNILLIEPRDNFYSSGSTLNWADKIDFSSDIIYEAPRDFQNYFNTLKYNERDNYYNEFYEKVCDVQEIGYGSKRFIFDSDFNSGEKEIKLKVFSSSPLKDGNIKGEYNKPQFVETRFLNENYPSSPIEYSFNTDVKQSLLFFSIQDFYDNSYSSTSDKTTLKIDSNTTHITSTGIDMTYKFPYCGHILKPYDLTSTDNFDLNFDTKLSTGNLWQKMFTGDDINSMTNRNLYNLYYRDTFNQILNKDSKLMTAYFNLKSTDIIKLKLNDIIFINNSYWIINKIIDYNPSDDKLTKVELLKITDGINIEFNDFITNTTLVPYIKNTIKSSKTNVIDSYDTLNIGKSNEIVDGSIVLKSDNIITEEKSVLISSDTITINSGATDVVVINEKNLNITESDVVYISGIKIKDGYILDSNAVIDGGKIEFDGIFNPFKFDTYHINSAGEDGNNIFDINIWEIEDSGEI